MFVCCFISLHPLAQVAIAVLVAVLVLVTVVLVAIVWPEGPKESYT